MSLFGCVILLNPDWLFTTLYSSAKMNHSETQAGEWSASIINLMESMNTSNAFMAQGVGNLNLLWQLIRQNREDMRQESGLSVETWYMVIFQVRV